jgi:hypothetical protein
MGHGRAEVVPRLYHPVEKIEKLIIGGSNKSREKYKKNPNFGSTEHLQHWQKIGCLYGVLAAFFIYETLY